MAARALLLSALLAALPHAASAQTAAASAQTPGVLHIKVTILDLDRKTIPVPRHALLISDDPATAPPRRVVTTLDGTVDVRLRPGRYTVESDQPVALLGSAYQWTEPVEIAPGVDTVLDLTSANAEITAADSATLAPGRPSPAVILSQWNDSLVALWTSTSRISGFVVDPRGLVATSQRAIANATSVEVQLTPAVKVEGRIVAADTSRDVAVVWFDPGSVTALHPVPLMCDAAASSVASPASPASAAPVAPHREIFALGVPLHPQQDRVADGIVSRVEQHRIESDLRIEATGAGGPVFAADGPLVGLVSVDEKRDGRRTSSHIVPVSDICDVVRSAAQKMPASTRPRPTRLPVEPARPFPPAALKAAVERRAGTLNPYQTTSDDFSIALITPPTVFAAQQPDRHTTSRDTHSVSIDQARVPALTDFANWSEYLADAPPVLLVRVTPKLVEGFWTSIARGAAVTQGVPLPAFKHFKAAFSRLRAFCGEVEVAPIHPFILESEVLGNEVVREGLYVYDPDALGPNCGTVKLVLYSDKSPERGDTRVVDPALIRQVWQDFEPYRVQ